MRQTVTRWLKRPATVGVAAASSIGGIVVGFALAHAAAHWPQFGDLPTWIAALAAIAAGVYAARTFQAQTRQYEKLRENEESANRLLAYQENAMARAFARKVNWQPGISMGAGDRQTTVGVSAQIRNESDGPIHDVVLRPTVDGREVPITKIRTMIRNESTGWVSSGGELDPGQPLEPLLPGFGVIMTATLSEPVSWRSWDMTARFTDEVRTRWQYNRDGTLILAPDHDW